MKNKPIHLLLLFQGLFLHLSAQGQLPDSLKHVFEYQKPKLGYTVDSSFTVGSVSVKRVTWLSADSFVVSAYITSPMGSSRKGRHPLVVFQHWAVGTKDEFLGEAVEYSKEGAVCLLNDTPWLCPGSKLTSFKRQGYEMFRQCVLNARCGIDLMEASFSVDESKRVFVGHSFGCQTGSILSGVEHRFRYFVLMTGVCSITQSSWDSQDPDMVAWRTDEPEGFRKWVNKLEVLNAENYLPYKVADCLVQVANMDEYVTSAENEAYIRCVPSPKRVLRYDATHSLEVKPAKKDRMKWVCKRI